MHSSRIEPFALYWDRAQEAYATTQAIPRTRTWVGERGWQARTHDRRQYQCGPAIVSGDFHVAFEPFVTFESRIHATLIDFKSSRTEYPKMHFDVFFIQLPKSLVGSTNASR